MFITRAPHSVVFVHGATFPRPLFFWERRAGVISPVPQLWAERSVFNV